VTRYLLALRYTPPRCALIALPFTSGVSARGLCLCARLPYATFLGWRFSRAIFVLGFGPLCTRAVLLPVLLLMCRGGLRGGRLLRTHTAWITPAFGCAFTHRARLLLRYPPRRSPPSALPGVFRRSRSLCSCHLLYAVATTPSASPLLVRSARFWACGACGHHIRRLPARAGLLPFPAARNSTAKTFIWSPRGTSAASAWRVALYALALHSSFGVGDTCCLQTAFLVFLRYWDGDAPALLGGGGAGGCACAFLPPPTWCLFRRTPSTTCDPTSTTTCPAFGSADCACFPRLTLSLLPCPHLYLVPSTTYT